MPDEIQKIKSQLASQRSYLRETYGVESIGIFGSFARNEATPTSDLDVLISLKEPISYFKFYDLEKDIASLVGRKVDLVTDQSIKTTIKAQVFKDLIKI